MEVRTNTEQRDLLAAARNTYRHALQHGALTFNHNGAQYSPIQTLRQWINGHYFHNDQDLAIQLAHRASDPTSAIFLRHALMTVLVEGAQYAKYLAECTTYWRTNGILTV